MGASWTAMALRAAFTPSKNSVKSTGSGVGVGSEVDVGVGSGAGVRAAVDPVGMGSEAGDSAAGTQPASRARTRDRDSSLRFSMEITFLFICAGSALREIDAL